MEEFITIKEQETAEIIEKKSKFIANVFYISNLEEVEKILEETRKKYYDARHNCYAYRVIDRDIIIERGSDDGEPSGTAGSPMLTILQKNNICNVLVIVTRYFGGILLGTGGLVRAYSEATIKVLEKTENLHMTKGYNKFLEIEYKDLELLKYYCKKMNIRIISTEYSENISLILEIEKNKENEFENLLHNKIKVINEKIISEKYVKKCETV